MRVATIGFALCLLALPALSPAEEKKDLVREISLRGLKRPMPDGDVHKPAAIANEKDLAKAIPEEEVQARVKKEVDFGKEKLLFFAWSGSGGDKVTPSVKDGEKGPEVVFRYQAGLTDDLRFHFRLFAVPKDATWRVEDK
jgi:hypothetical protein